MVLFCCWVYENEMPAAISFLKPFRSKCCRGLLTQPAHKGCWRQLNPPEASRFCWQREKKPKTTLFFCICCHTDIKTAFSKQSATYSAPVRRNPDLTEQTPYSYWISLLSFGEFWKVQQCNTERGRGLYVVLPAVLDIKLFYSHFWQLFFKTKNNHGMYLCWLYGRDNFLERIECFLCFRYSRCCAA